MTAYPIFLLLQFREVAVACANAHPCLDACMHAYFNSEVTNISNKFGGTPGNSSPYTVSEGVSM